MTALDAGPAPARGAATTTVDVLVVGAGVAGLGMATMLARRGRESFVVLERGPDVGGTWRENRYPGVACDVPAHLYSFSFRPAPDWSRVYAPGPEIHAYLRACARDEGLEPHLRLGVEMQDARWDAAASRWEVATTSGRFRARTLVVAAGRLSEPSLPEIPGLDGFPGPVLHSARWEPGTDLAGARVGVVGTGASAAQIVPALAGRARSLVVFARTPPWVVPRGDRAYTAAERRTLTGDPEAAQSLRARLFDDAEGAIRARRREHPALEELRGRAAAHLVAQVPDPALRARLRPDYEIGCKRIVVSDDFYPALGRDDVVLEDSALVRVDGAEALAGSGARHRLDALVLATGFRTARLPFAERVRGRGGRRLADRWAGGMTTHASVAVPGFPNMFVLDGPNAALGHNSAVAVIEAQVEHVVGALDELGRDPAPLEATVAAERATTRDVDARGAGTVWLTGGCRSWYLDPGTGRLGLLWPDTARAFRERNGRFDPADYGRPARRSR